MTVYRIFGIGMDCPVALAGLPAVAGQTPAWRVRRLPGRPADRDYEWRYTWRETDGRELMACGRNAAGYVLRFNGIARFTIDFATSEIGLWPEPGCAENTLAHLLIDQVMPRIVCHRGQIVVHASAVLLSSGQAIAFTGESGRGKSTLATAFYRQGHSVIADDCLLLERRSGSVLAMPSYPSLRLWPDSAEMLAEATESAGRRFSEVAHYTRKRQLLFADNGTPPTGSWVKLERIYLLEDPATPLAGSQVEIQPAGGMNTIMALVNAMFALDPLAESSLRRNFEAVRKVAGEISASRLSYPRSYRVLPKVVAAVTRDLAGSTLCA